MAVLSVQKATPQMLGCHPGSTAGSLAISTTAVLAFSFVAPVSPFGGTMRLKDITVHVSATTGSSPTLTAKLYTNNAGVPGTLIEAGSASAALSAGWWTLTGFTVTSNLTPGTLYWVCLFRSAGTTITVTWATGGFYPNFSAGAAGSGITWGFTKAASADSGSTWGTAAAACSGWRIGLTDGTDDAYIGTPIDAAAGANAASEKCYGSHMFGVQFTTPANAVLNVVGIGLTIRKSSATGNVVLKLYGGAAPNLLATAQAIPNADINTAAWPMYMAWLPARQVIQPGTVLTIELSDSAADGTNAYFYTLKFPIHDDANSKACLPFGGLKTATYDGSNWSYLDTEFAPFVLLLDSAAEFGARLMSLPDMDGGLCG